METFTPATVQQAAVFLDRNVPGWEHYINLGALDMLSPYACILAQLWDKHPLFLGADNCINPWDGAMRILGVDGNVFADFDDAWADAVKDRLALPPVRDLATL
jgi:hypothetical protein